MFRECLAREKELSVKSIEETLSLVRSEFRVEKKGADLKNITLDQGGMLSWGEDSYPITDWAFESLCRLVKIRPAYARSIPSDLFFHTFDRLKGEYNRRVVIIMCHGVVINLMPHPYLPARNEDFILGIRKVANILSLELEKIRISDRGINFTFLKSGLQVEPVKGDITRIGLSIFNSETGDRSACAYLYLLRLICKNGATLRENWGSVSWTYTHRKSYERAMEDFFENILELNIDFNRFDRTYKRLVDQEIRAIEFLKVHRSLTRIVGGSDADRITGVNKYELKKWDREIKEQGNYELSSGIILYDLYNNVTESARRYPYFQRIEIERIGGSLIDLA